MRAASRIERARAIVGWRHWAWAAGLAVVFSLSVPVVTLDLNRYWALERVILHTPWVILFSFIFVASIGWVESGSGGPAFPLWRYAASIAVASAICMALAWSFGTIIPRAPYNVEDGQLRAFHPVMDTPLYDRFSAVYLALHESFNAMLAALISARLRNSRIAARALAGAQVARTEANRKLLASSLEAAEARVDPAVVIETLERIERQYNEDPAAAEARLDELIAFLRGAIPHLRSISLPAAEAPPQVRA